MRKRRRATVVLLLLALAFLLAAGARVYAAWDTNRQIEEAFKPLEETYASAPQSPYLAGVPMHEMDLEALDYYADMVAIPLPGAPVWEAAGASVMLPEDLHYYETPEAEAPCHTIPAGTEVVLFAWLGGQYFSGYGLDGYPTYDAAWRYMRRLWEGNGQVTKEIWETLPFGSVSSRQNVHFVCKHFMNNSHPALTVILSAHGGVANVVFDKA